MIEVNDIDNNVCPVKVFYSYSHKDRELREELEKQLASLRRIKLIIEWHDGRIIPGQIWEEAINDNFNSADIVLILVSADFVDSYYCYDKEFKHALERHDRGDVQIIPIIIRPVYWQETPFAKFQVLPSGGRPVTEWESRDKAWLDVVKGIRQAINQFYQWRIHQKIELLKVETNPIIAGKIARDIYDQSCGRISVNDIKTLEVFFYSFDPTVQYWIVKTIGKIDYPEGVTNKLLKKLFRENLHPYAKLAFEEVRRDTSQPS